MLGGDGLKVFARVGQFLADELELTQFVRGLRLTRLSRLPGGLAGGFLE